MSIYSIIYLSIYKCICIKGGAISPSLLSSTGQPILSSAQVHLKGRSINLKIIKGTDSKFDLIKWEIKIKSLTCVSNKYLNCQFSHTVQTMIFRDIYSIHFNYFRVSPIQLLETMPWTETFGSKKGEYYIFLQGNVFPCIIVAFRNTLGQGRLLVTYLLLVCWSAEGLLVHSADICFVLSEQC